MLDLREIYLGELRAALETRMRSDEVSIRLQEVEAHLADGIEGRLELGLDAETAVQESLSAFGNPRQVAQAMIDEVAETHQATKLRYLNVFMSVIIGYVAMVWWLAEHVNNGLALLALTGLALISVVGVTRSSFRSRRPTPIPLFVTGIAGTLILWVVMGLEYLNLWAYDGAGFSARYGVGPSAYQTYNEATRKAIELAQADPLGNFFSQAGMAFSYGMAITSVAILVDLLASSLGIWCFRVRRSRYGRGFRA